MKFIQLDPHEKGRIKVEQIISNNNYYYILYERNGIDALSIIDCSTFKCETKLLDDEELRRSTFIRSRYYNPIGFRNQNEKIQIVKNGYIWSISYNPLKITKEYQFSEFPIHIENYRNLEVLNYRKKSNKKINIRNDQKSKMLYDSTDTHFACSGYKALEYFPILLGKTNSISVLKSKTKTQYYKNHLFTFNRRTQESKKFKTDINPKIVVLSKETNTEDYCTGNTVLICEKYNYDQFQIFDLD